ncbi:hypothetical protein TNCV_4958221 [Trichonephila clavipes]|nr:hypothetical protein TNCV_4958221 [Trichonephila clavipes]
MREKGDNRLVPGPDYVVDDFPIKLLEFLASHYRRVCPDGMQHLFCWPILAVSSQSLASNGPVVDSRYLNLVFGSTEVTYNK